MSNAKTKAPTPTNIVLRSQNTQDKYMRAWEEGEIRSLHEEEVLKAWKYWLLINNRFPYDMVFREHHMLVPKRTIGSYDGLTWRERRELRKIIDTYCQQHYSVTFENMKQTRTIQDIFHLHCGTYHRSGEVELLAKPKL